MHDSLLEMEGCKIVGILWNAVFIVIDWLMRKSVYPLGCYFHLVFSPHNFFFLTEVF